MQTGFVALLDVLGFASLVLGDGGDDRVSRYLEHLVDALYTGTATPRVDYVVFSDSIVLTTPDDSEASLQALILRCSTILGLMLQNEIPLRGAIACGSYLRAVRRDEPRGTSTSGVFVAGKAIIDAYNFETAQDWVGIMLAPSAVKRVPDLARRCAIEGDFSKEGLQKLRERLAWAPYLQPCHDIPFRSRNPLEGYAGYDGFAIVPSNGVSEPMTLRDSLKVSLESLQWLKSLAPGPSEQAKYQRCSSWLFPIQRIWSDVAYWMERHSSEGSEESLDPS